MPRHELTAEFVINTPMFISGADQEQAELRVASIKGAIRFWWRALNYSKYEGNSAERLAAMKADEDRLFGSTKGQSQILFYLDDQTASSIKDLPETKNKTPTALGMRYLGYGVMESNGSLEHPCIPSGKFAIRLLSKSPIGNCIIDAIKLFGLVGGLGSRSRKGYGSVTLFKLSKDNDEYWSSPSSYENYQKEINQLLEVTRVYNIQPQITAFYRDTKIYYLGKGSKAKDILGNYGLMMMRYRSAGSGWEIKDYTVEGHKKLFNSEKRFEDDHDWYKEINGWRNKDNNFHPKRVIFGLPHNYHKKEIHHVEPETHERRASPLFFHIHKIGNSYVGIALIMKSDFLPNGEKIKAGNNTVDQSIQYKILTDFLTGYKRDKPNIDTKEPYFPDLQLIHPQEDKL